MKEYIVIGAGILGASTAYHLAKAGAKVTVVDRQDPGQATDAAAGIICPWLSQRRNKAWYALAKNGAAYYPKLIEQLEAEGEKDTGYSQVGAISLHTDAEKLDKMEARARKRLEGAPEIGEIRQLTSEDTSAYFPPLSEIYSSLHVSGAARVNGRALREALVRAAEKNGARVIHGSAELVHHEDKVTGVRVGAQVIEADVVIVTAGAWAADLLTPLGLDLAVDSQKAQIIHLQVDNEETGDWPVVMPPNDQYILAFDDGQIVAGATHENGKGFNRRVTAGGVREILDKALTVAPGLEEGTFVETRVGFRPFTPNFLPIIGEVPKWKGLLLANGLGASGLTVGPFLGSELAKLALGEQLTIELDLYDLTSALKSE